MITDPARAMTAQFYLQARLKEDGVFICFSGVMDVPERWDVLRRALVKFNFGSKQLTSRETYQQAFERATGTPLIKPLESAA